MLHCTQCVVLYSLGPVLRMAWVGWSRPPRVCSIPGLSLQVTQAGVSPPPMMSPNKALMRRHYSSPKFGLSLTSVSDPGERRGSVTSTSMACSLTRSVE